MTLNDLHGNSTIASVFNWDFLFSYAAFDKISTDIAHPCATAELFCYYYNVKLLFAAVSWKKPASGNT